MTSYILNEIKKH